MTKAVLIAKRRLKPGGFTSWEARFVDRGTERSAAGCSGATYYRSIDDPDVVVMLLRWQTQEQGLAFLDEMIAQFPHLSGGGGAAAELDYEFVNKIASLPN